MEDHELKKRLTELISLDDWTDRCSKCGYPKLIHKPLHRDATCTNEPESMQVLNKHWDEFTKRVKPILRMIKEEDKKELQEGILLKGLKELVESNNMNMSTGLKELVESNNVNMDKLVKSLVKEEDGSDTTRPRTETRVARVTKPAKVPSWMKKMSLETYVKQLTTWTEINVDVPE